ncbi:isoflavone reductase [Lasiosphaeria ovina]|uniref:Isoflavone reductase n=1 Tax=Lasiosphaeria ovina TaxID=92902 RepID=A0AAE0KI73_9PEZI|nr:isoflavone reductase [Lasiosphaeria ovina]
MDCIHAVKFRHSALNHLKSVESLTKAFAGQDAVVSTIGSYHLDDQRAMIDAVVAAGVSRFLPSEYGHDTRRLDGVLGAMLAGKAAIADYAAEQAKTHPAFTWTTLGNVDAGIFGVNLKDKTTALYESGDTLMTVSTTAFIGRAVAAVLQHEAETANRHLDVFEFRVSQNMVLKVFEEETGAKFAVSHRDMAAVDSEVKAKFAKGDYSIFVDALLVHNFCDGASAGLKNEHSANGLLGLETNTLREMVREYIRTRSS